MMLYKFHKEYENLSDDRKKAGLKRLFDELLRDPGMYEDLIDDILRSAINVEEDDGFGTEGLDV